MEKDQTYLVALNWFAVDLVDSFVECFHEEFTLSVTSESHDHRLLSSVNTLEGPPAFLRKLVAIHDRHAQVRKNKTILTADPFIVFLDALLQHIKGFFAAKADLDPCLCVI